MYIDIAGFCVVPEVHAKDEKNSACTSASMVSAQDYGLARGEHD